MHFMEEMKEFVAYPYPQFIIPFFINFMCLTLRHHCRYVWTWQYYAINIYDAYIRMVFLRPTFPTRGMLPYRFRSTCLYMGD